MTDFCNAEVNFDSLNIHHPDVELLAAYHEILSEEDNHECDVELYSLYKYFEENKDSFESLTEAEDDNALATSFDATSDTEDVPEDFSDDSEDDSSEEDEELGRNEETFDNKYPEVNQEETLKKVYDEWLVEVSNKPFYKTVESYYQSSQSGTLNFVDRNFLWKLIKAISSCITHLFIEGEQKEEAICLVDKYYDSLINCLNSVVHASSKEDVSNAFLYMVDFLGFVREDEEATDNDTNEEIDKF